MKKAVGGVAVHFGVGIADVSQAVVSERAP